MTAGRGKAPRAAPSAVDGILACITFRRDIPDPGHDLLRGFRAGDPAAFARVVAAVGEALDRRGDVAPPGTLAVVVPGHQAGAVNAPCRTLVEVLAPTRGWIVAEAGLLRRVADAPEGKGFGPRDPAVEATTLAWDPSHLPAGTRHILLVDDVVASGSTLRAALAALPATWQERTTLFAAFRSVMAT